MAGLGVLEVSDATFDQEVLKSEQPVLVDFWAVWCGPCKAIAPAVDALAAKYAGQLKVAKVNVDQNGATPSRYGIRGIPALLFFKGGKVADQIVGYVPQDVIEEKVQKVIWRPCSSVSPDLVNPKALPCAGPFLFVAVEVQLKRRPLFHQSAH